MNKQVALRSPAKPGPNLVRTVPFLRASWYSPLFAASYWREADVGGSFWSATSELLRGQKLSLTLQTCLSDLAHQVDGFEALLSQRNDLQTQLGCNGELSTDGYPHHVPLFYALMRAQILDRLLWVLLPKENGGGVRQQFAAEPQQEEPSAEDGPNRWSTYTSEFITHATLRLEMQSREEGGPAARGDIQAVTGGCNGAPSAVGGPIGEVEQQSVGWMASLVGSSIQLEARARLARVEANLAYMAAGCLVATNTKVRTKDICKQNSV